MGVARQYHQLFFVFYVSFLYFINFLIIFIHLFSAPPRLCARTIFSNNELLRSDPRLQPTTGLGSGLVSLLTDRTSGIKMVRKMMES